MGTTHTLDHEHQALLWDIYNRLSTGHGRGRPVEPIHRGLHCAECHLSCVCPNGFCAWQLQLHGCELRTDLRL